MTGSWAAVDPLGEALHFLRMSGVFYCRSELTAPWGLALPPMDRCLTFHVVTSGRCWLEVEGVEPTLRQRGDLALVPHGEGHVLRSEPEAEAAKLFDLPRELVSDRYEILRYGRGRSLPSPPKPRCRARPSRRASRSSSASPPSAT